MSFPRMEREMLLKAGLWSAVGSTRHRAKVSTGNREESARRACRAANLADVEASEGGGEGSWVRSWDV